MSKVAKETTERVYSTCLGLMPVLLVLFVLNLGLFKSAGKLPLAQLPYLVGLGFFGVLQILVSLIFILAFLRLSDMSGALPKLAMAVKVALLFFPMIIFAIEFVRL